jgi:anti-sigma regulatory factor (Ser/Thr protein kinase)
VTQTIQLRLSPSRLAPATARGALGPLREAVDEETAQATALLVSELVTNAVRHAGLRGDQWIDLAVEASPERVRVSVADPGHGFARHPSSPRVGHPSGWGLFLVGELADRWGIDRDWDTLVWFEIDRRGSGRTR